MLGFIYIMSNPAHSGLLKIGQTSKDPLVRRKDLSSTGVPEEFVIGSMNTLGVVSTFNMSNNFIQ